MKLILDVLKDENLLLAVSAARSFRDNGYSGSAVVVSGDKKFVVIENKSSLTVREYY